MANGNPYMIDVGSPFSGAVGAYQQAKAQSAQQERQDRLAGLQSQIYQQQIQAGQAEAQREAQRQEQLAGFREFRNQEGYDELEAAKQFPLAVPEIQQWGQYRTELRERGGQEKSQTFYNLTQDAIRTGDRTAVDQYLEQEQGLIDGIGDRAVTANRLQQAPLDQLSKMAVNIHRQAGGDVQRLTGAADVPEYSNVYFSADGDPVGLNKKTASFEKIQTPIKKPKPTAQTIVNLGDTGKEAEMKALGQSRVKTATAIQESAFAAQDQLDNIKQLKALDVKTGFGTGMKTQAARVVDFLGGMVKNC